MRSYEHPLAYLLGIEGLALLRGFRGEHDRAFVDARIAEVRRLLDDAELTGAGVEVDRVGTVEGYRIWAPTYDTPNTAFDMDEPVVGEILDALPAGVALDAACGTARWSAALAGRGHRVIGVDSSPEMLARARTRVPAGEFRIGELHRLPVDDGAVELVVCALAVAHVAELGPVLAELARVLRPGGHLVISDMHPEAVARASVPAVRDADGRPGRIATHRHLVGDYLRAALAAGLRVRDFTETRRPAPGPPPDGDRAPAGPGPWDRWPWSLAAMVPEATRAADTDVPAMLVWHFQLPPDERPENGPGQPVSRMSVPDGHGSAGVVAP